MNGVPADQRDDGPRLPAQGLRRDMRGRLVFRDAQGISHVGVSVIRAFPLSAPEQGLAIVNADGHELAWIPDCDDVDQGCRSLLQAAAAEHDFMPLITRLRSVSSVATPSTWTVDTDRGQTRFILSAEDNLRRLGNGGLLIMDSHGLNYRIERMDALDKDSRRLLDHFL